MRWKNGANSPVLLFIDDLCNTYVDMESRNKGYLENDWGYFKRLPDSAFDFLLKEIMTEFPEIKVTFFVPVGKRSPVIADSNVGQISKPINTDDESIRFYSSIDKEDRFEVAYHGTTHGKPGRQARDFGQEWETYKDLNHAISVITNGRNIFKQAVGRWPTGGKYCGYKSNLFSDESVDRSDFRWWCRYANRAAVEGNPEEYFSGTDKNPLTAYDIKYFGKNKVLDIPTTIPGDLLNPIYKKRKGIKGLLKFILRPLLIKLKLREIDFLIKNGLVVSIQEHISPARVDGKRQTPNIFDDRKSLITIFRYLRKKKVWYCTGSELEDWVRI